MTSGIGTCLVVGCGSIGRRRLRNLRALGVRSLLTVDPRADRRDQAASETGAIAFATAEEALDRQPACVIVATPTAFHVPVALDAARRGCHLFVEKPLSHTMQQVDELIATAERKRLVTMVACNYRFDTSLNLVKRLVDEGAVGNIVSARAEFGFYLPYSHPHEDYRETYPAKKGLGGGLLLDRTHELDYLRWIFGEVQGGACFYAKRTSLEIETEDVAEILLRFESGVIASIHLDYVEREYRCAARIIGDAGTIQWAFWPHRVRLYSAKSNDWKVLLDDPNPDINNMYLAELAHFLDSVRRQTPTCHALTDGRKLLEILLRLKETPVGVATTT
jgi:predicted dehydrogenase